MSEEIPLCVFGELSKSDRELVENDLACFGSCFISITESGAKRLDPAKVILKQEANGKAVVEEPSGVPVACSDGVLSHDLKESFDFTFRMRLPHK